MIIIDLLILIIIICLIYIQKNLNRVLRFSCIITIVLGYIILFMSFIINLIIKKNLTYINASRISSIIVSKFINRGLTLILFGGIELIVYTIIRIKKRITVKQ